MANPQYLLQALQLCHNALRQPQFLTQRQKRRFRSFIQDMEQGNTITDKQLNNILRHIKKAHQSLTLKVGGPDSNTAEIKGRVKNGTQK